MNDPVSTQLDRMDAGSPAEAPAAFISAVRRRARQRLIVRAGGSVLMLAVAATVSMIAFAGSTPDRNLADRNASHRNKAVPLPAPEVAIVQVALPDPDRLPEPAGLGAADGDHLFRTGDNWDPDRVERWVLN